MVKKKIPKILLSTGKKKKNSSKKILLVWKFHPALHLQSKNGTGTQLILLRIRTSTPLGIWFPAHSFIIPPKQVAVRVLHGDLTTRTNMNNIFCFSYSNEASAVFLFIFYTPFWNFPNFYPNDSFKPQIYSTLSDPQNNKMCFRSLQNCMPIKNPLQKHLISEVHHCHFHHIMASLKRLFLTSPSEVSDKYSMGVWGQQRRTKRINKHNYFSKRKKNSSDIYKPETDVKDWALIEDLKNISFQWGDLFIHWTSRFHKTEFLGGFVLI